MGDDGHWRPPICSAVWNVGTPSPRPYWPDTTELALLDVRPRATWRWAGPTPSGRDLAYLNAFMKLGDRESGAELAQVLRGHPLHAANACGKLLHHMVQYMTTRLDTSFAALSDATRRGVLEQLGRADASITDLAEKFHMTLTGMKKHVGVLEQAGLVTTKKIGRVRNCQLGPRRLEEETAWLERYRQRWDERFDELDKVVEELTRKEKSDERKNRK